MNSYPDEHYHTWPHPITADELQRGEYLRSLTPREELALFMAARGHCLQDIGQKSDTYVSYAHAHKLAPKLPENLWFLRDALRQEVDPRELAILKVEAARMRAEAFFAENARLKVLNDERRDRETRRVMEFNLRARQNPLTPFAADVITTEFDSLHPDPGFQFPH